MSPPPLSRLFCGQAGACLPCPPPPPPNPFVGAPFARLGSGSRPSVSERSRAHPANVSDPPPPPNRPDGCFFRRLGNGSRPFAGCQCQRDLWGCGWAEPCGPASRAGRAAPAAARPAREWKVRDVAKVPFGTISVLKVPFGARESRHSRTHPAGAGRAQRSAREAGLDQSGLMGPRRETMVIGGSRLNVPNVPFGTSAMSRKWLSRHGFRRVHGPLPCGHY
jgi:hypothetical protein